MKCIEIITRMFPLWAVFLSVLAYLFPQLFVGFKGGIVPLLAIVMLSMGLTLSMDDFRLVVSQKKAVALGVCLQFLVMPLLAFVLGRVLGLEDVLLVGMILVGSVAGGTASNVICFLAKGSVALSITMTACSTLVGVFLTPLLVGLYAHQVVDVPLLKMLISLLKIVLLPVSAGVLLNTFFRKKLTFVMPVLPLTAMVVIVFIIAIVVALNAKNINSIGFSVALGVMLHNGFGLVLGYYGARLLKFDDAVCKTVAIEVGMQNSGLAVALAMKYFSPVSALPGAMFSIWHNVTGSLLAGYWSSKSKS